MGFLVFIIWHRSWSATIMMHICTRGQIEKLYSYTTCSILTWIYDIVFSSRSIVHWMILSKCIPFKRWCSYNLLNTSRPISLSKEAELWASLTVFATHILRTQANVKLTKCGLFEIACARFATLLDCSRHAFFKTFSVCVFCAGLFSAICDRCFPCSITKIVLSLAFFPIASCRCANIFRKWTKYVLYMATICFVHGYKSLRILIRKNFALLTKESSR